MPYDNSSGIVKLGADSGGSWYEPASRLYLAIIILNPSSRSLVLTYPMSQRHLWCGILQQSDWPTSIRLASLIRRRFLIELTGVQITELILNFWCDWWNRPCFCCRSDLWRAINILSELNLQNPFCHVSAYGLKGMQLGKDLAGVAQSLVTFERRFFQVYLCLAAPNLWTIVIEWII